MPSAQKRMNRERKKETRPCWLLSATFFFEQTVKKAGVTAQLWEYIFFQIAFAFNTKIRSTFAKKNIPVKLIDKMSLGAGALKVEGPTAQKGSLALEVTMATKRAPTTQHRHTEENFSGILTTTHIYLSRGREEWEQNRQLSQSVVMICNDHKAKQSEARQSWNMPTHVSPWRLHCHPAQACMPGAQPLTCKHCLKVNLA